MVTNTTIYTRQMYVSLSNDVLDVDFRNGDEVYLIDTRQRVIYDEENHTWHVLSTGGGSGDTYFTTPSTGCIYPRVLNQTLVGFNASGYGTNRWSRCVNMEEATVEGLVSITGGQNNSPFGYCTALKRLTLPSLSTTNTYTANGCTALEQVQLGSVGHPVTALSQYTFSGDTQAGLTITIYVADNTTIPLGSSPWGATNATIIYRSSTTGEVRT